MADAVSSFAGVKIPEGSTCSTQESASTAAGLAFCAVSDRVLERLRRGAQARYFDFLNLEKSLAQYDAGDARYLSDAGAERTTGPYLRRIAAAV